jgi:protein arginine kinase
MFDEFLNNQRGWLSAKGPNSEIVISSRLRLARNLQGYPFPGRASLSQKYEILDQLNQIYTQIKQLNEAVFVRMEEVEPLDRQFLLERHLISQEHTVPVKGKGVVLSRDELFSMMINEEDHIRLQVITSGFDLHKCWHIIDELDDALSTRVSFAFLPDFGYLTSCPTNVGTALRASCMLHLPGLVLTKRINKILELLAKLSFTTRGLFGEGTQALGNFFQISNQVSLGLSEAELIENLSGIVRQIKEQEELARETLLRRYKYTVEDNVWRAWGILKNARLITTKEALSHLSMLSLGSSLGIIKGIRPEAINNLFIIIQPAHLQKIEGRCLKEEERDYTRASLLRKYLRSV